MTSRGRFNSPQSSALSNIDSVEEDAILLCRFVLLDYLLFNPGFKRVRCDKLVIHINNNVAVANRDKPINDYPIFADPMFSDSN